MGTLTITLDYIQDDGTAVTPTNNVVYRWTTDSLNIGDSIEGIETTTDPSTLDKNHYLKHDIEDNKITTSYVCFVTDTEHCMQGGNASYYENNNKLLQGQETWFINSGGRCSFNDSYSYCDSGDFRTVSVYSSGNVNAIDGSLSCSVVPGGRSDCS